MCFLSSLLSIILYEIPKNYMYQQKKGGEKKEFFWFGSFAAVPFNGFAANILFSIVVSHMRFPCLSHLLPNCSPLASGYMNSRYVRICRHHQHDSSTSSLTHVDHQDRMTAMTIYGDLLIKHVHRNGITTFAYQVTRRCFKAYSRVCVRVNW